MTKVKILLIASSAILGLFLVLWAPWRGSGKGVSGLFQSDSFHYQALRAMGHSVYQGASPAEALSVISRIRDQDENSWFAEWSGMGKKCEQWAEKAADPVSRGNALLRASNYYRASEFFLPPDDPRKSAVYERSVQAFRDALGALGIRHNVYPVPCEGGTMTTYYFRGRGDAPLVLVCGGFDSTNEESYFWIGRALIDRGYSVAMFDGPGQSGMLRRFNVKFTPEWHRPVGRVIDHLLRADPSLREKKKILFGISLGGILMGRAAAFEPRVDGAVLFGSPFDFLDGALYQLPGFARSLFYGGHSAAFNALANIKKRFSIATRWGINNGMMSMGGGTPYDFLLIGKRFTLKDVHERVTCPVLVLYGERDLFVSDGIQDAQFRRAFRNARCYTLKTFPFQDGSSEHCQAGAIEQVAMEFSRWMREKGLAQHR